MEPNERERIGGNYPPEPIDFLESRDRIAGLLTEAENWLDGTKIETQAQADDVARLMVLFREAVEEAHERRRIEVEPVNTLKDAIQARWNALVGDTKTVKGSAVLALSACKALLLPWEVDQENKRREAAEAKRIEAEQAERDARLAHVVTSPSDLAGRREAEEAAAAAVVAKADAKRADREKSATKAGGRSLGVRKTYTAKLSDRRAFLNWMVRERPEAMEELLRLAAADLVKAGMREIPGVDVIEGASLS